MMHLLTNVFRCSIQIDSDQKQAVIVHSYIICNNTQDKLRLKQVGCMNSYQTTVESGHVSLKTRSEIIDMTTRGVDKFLHFVFLSR